MSIFTILVDFGSGYEDITQHCEDLKKNSVLHNKLISTINTCTFFVTDRDVATQFLTAVSDSLVLVEKDAVTWFKGFVRPNSTHTVGSTFKKCAVEVYDKSILLQRKVDQSICYQNFKVSDPTDKPHSILHQLFYEAGLIDAELNFTTIDVTVDYFVVERTDDKSYKEYVDGLLFEYGYVYNCGTNGVFSLHDMYPDPIPATLALIDSQLHQNLSISKMENRYQTVKVSWSPHRTITDKLVFSCAQDGSDGEKCNVPIVAGDYYPADSDLKDIYTEYKITEGELLILLSASLNWSGAGVSLNTWTPGFRRALVKFYSAAGGALTLFDITGNAVVRDTTVVNRSAQYLVSSSEEILTIEAEYINSKTASDHLCNGVAKYFTYSSYTYSFETEEALEVGAYRELDEAVMDVLQKVRVISVNENEDGVRSVVCEGVDNFTAGTIEDQDTISSPETTTESRGDGDIFVAKIEDQDGYNGAGGTTTPTQVTVGVCKAVATRAIHLEWDRQLNLTNFDHYEVQVSADQSSWYSLKFDGTDWKDVLGSVTPWPGETLTHSGIPPIVAVDEPGGRRLYYKVRRVTKAPVSGAYSAVVSAVTNVVENGDLAADSVFANNIEAGAIRARELSFGDDVYGNAPAFPDGAELFDLAQPDCLSSVGRIPTTREIVFAPSEIEDEVGNKYRGPHAPRFNGQSGALFEQRTNFAPTPEDLTSSSWGNYSSTDLLTSYEYDERCFTKITATGASGHVYSGTLCSTAGVKSFQCIVKKGVGNYATILVQEDGADYTQHLTLSVVWSTHTVVATNGTLYDSVWIDNEMVWIAGISTAFAAAEALRLVLFAGGEGCAVGDSAYYTGVQLEDNVYPSPYIDRRRWITQTRPAITPHYSLAMPGKFLFKVKVKPWFMVDSAEWHRVFEWGIDATHIFTLLWTPGSDTLFVAWQDGGTSRAVVFTSMTSGNIHQEWTIFCAINLDSGIATGSAFYLFDEAGALYSFATTWGAAPDVKASTFPILDVGNEDDAALFDGVISDEKFWAWDGVSLGTISTLEDVDNAIEGKTALLDLELEAYETEYQPFTKQGAISVFPATTNLIPSPEDLTATGWNLEGATTRALSSYYIEGKRFTLITTGAANTGIYYSHWHYTGNTVKGFSCWLRRGTAPTLYGILWDSTASTSRLEFTITWATHSIAMGAGTLQDYQFVSDDLLWVSFVASSVTAANEHQLYFRSATAGGTYYVTGIMTEDSLWSTPYTPTKRTAGSLAYTLPAGLPDKFSIVFWWKPWATYGQVNWARIFECYIDATHRLLLYIDNANGTLNIFWQDGGTARYLIIQMGATIALWNQWQMGALVCDLSVGGIVSASFLKGYAPGVTTAVDVGFGGNIDAMVSKFTTLQVGIGEGEILNGLISDFMFLPGVLLSELDCDEHYYRTRPWFSPTEAASGNRSVRIDRSGIRMHNASLTISDNRNRLIDISNRTGLLAKDAAGTIIHDIPNAPILSGMAYGGHVLWFDAAAFIEVIAANYTDNLTNRSWTSSIINTTLAEHLPLGLTNIKGAVLSVRLRIVIQYDKIHAGATTYCTVIAKYATQYNTTPLINNRMCGLTAGPWQLDAHTYNIIGWEEDYRQCLVPVVYSGGAPYITWDLDAFWTGMCTDVGAYWVEGWIVLEGVTV